MHKRVYLTRGLFVAACVLALVAAGASWAGSDASNRDIYFQQAGSSTAGPSSAGSPQDSGEASQASTSQPTIRYWVERAETRDLLLDSKGGFRSGDKIYFKFGTNVECYAYLVCKGSSGKVTMMFPGIAGPDNHVQPRTDTTVPTIKTPFVFDETPGVERLCLVISPNPVQEWEQMAEQARDLEEPLNLSSAQQNLWDQVAASCVTLGKSKDLTLEQYESNDDGQGGNYVTDHGQEGFTRPVAVYLDLEHQP